MKHVRHFMLLSLLSILISCNDNAIEPIDRTLVTVSGYANGTYELEAEFDYSIIQNPGAPSSFRLYIKKNGTPRFELFLDLEETGNEFGFEPGIPYHYQPPYETGINLFPRLTFNGIRFYTPSEETTTNFIEFTSIEDTRIKGRFELNLLYNSVHGDENIKVAGTFDAVGKIMRRN